MRYVELHTTQMKNVAVPSQDPGRIFHLKKIQTIYFHGETFIQKRFVSRGKIIDSLSSLLNKAANYFEGIKWHMLLSYWLHFITW